MIRDDIKAATIAAMKSLAEYYITMGRQTEAFKLYEDALAARKRALPKDHPETLADLDGLSSVYFMLGRYSEALEYRKEALAIRRTSLPKDHPDTIENLWAIAVSLDKLNRGEEAIPLIDECLALAKGKKAKSEMIPQLYIIRISVYRKRRDEYECRRTAENWERLGLPDATSLYNAGCFRAIAAEQFSKSNKTAEAKRDADVAMEWLQKAIAAGFDDASSMKKDADLDALRSRDDFKKLVDSMEKKGNKK
jgi:tetratricopeptide (TPR) repeat protein